jgi:hypothetical protein
MEIRKSTIHQVYLVSHDEIDIPRLVHPAAVQALSAVFDFAQSGVSQEPAALPSVNFQIGALSDEAGQVPVLRLAIEERRILIDAEGTSSDADRVFRRLIDHLRGLTGSSDPGFLMPIVKAEESEIVAQLDFATGSLISQAVAQFIAGALEPRLHSSFATASAKLGQITYVIQYQPSDLSLDDHRISLSRKEFILGPRAGFPLSDRIYYSRAPVDTSTHVQLLQFLESIIQKTPAA